jgi:type VI protein secretion system component VasF
VSDTRTPESIEGEIEQARDQLVATLAQIKAQTAPAALARRGGRAVAGLFTNEQGGIRPERIAASVGVVAAVVGLKIWGRSRRRCHCH